MRFSMTSICRLERRKEESVDAVSFVDPYCTQFLVCGSLRNKQVVVIKLLNAYTNNKPQDPHGCKEQVKIKYEATKAIVGKFPNGTATLMKLRSNAPVPLDRAGYCALPKEDQLLWELRADALNQSILHLLNLKNKNAKKDLCLAYSQGNNTAYQSDIKSMARYLSTQYPNHKPAN